VVGRVHSQSRDALVIPLVLRWHPCKKRQKNFRACLREGFWLKRAFFESDPVWVKRNLTGLLDPLLNVNKVRS
jgi:hypothetical protein